MMQMHVNLAAVIVLALILSSICANGYRFPIKKAPCDHPNRSYNSICIKGTCEFQCMEDGLKSGKCIGSFILTATCCCIV